MKHRILPYAIILAIAAIYLVPVLYVVSVSLRPVGTAFSGSLVPAAISTASYTTIFSSASTSGYLANSLIVAIGSTVLAVLVGALAAYGFARYRVRGQEGIFVGLLSIRAFPPVLIAIAYFQILVDLRLYDTLVALILLNALVNIPLVVWMLRNYFEAVPRELDEAALIDGCSRLGVFWRIVLPLSRPGLAAVSVEAALLAWNEYLFALTFISSDQNKPATVAIFDFIGQWSTNYIGITAFAVVLSVPVVLAFALMQRFLVRGLMAGSEQ